jgi:hypothetical protein
MLNTIAFSVEFDADFDSLQSFPLLKLGTQQLRPTKIRK